MDFVDMDVCPSLRDPGTEKSDDEKETKLRGKT